MSQSGYIAALLLAAFVLFLAARNRLGVYAAVLWGDTAKPVPGTQDAPFVAPSVAPPSGSGPSGLLGSVTGVLGTGGGIAGLLGDAGPIALLP